MIKILPVLTTTFGSLGHRKSFYRRLSPDLLNLLSIPTLYTANDSNTLRAKIKRFVVVNFLKSRNHITLLCFLLICKRCESLEQCYKVTSAIIQTPLQLTINFSRNRSKENLSTISKLLINMLVLIEVFEISYRTLRSF